MCNTIESSHYKPKEECGIFGIYGHEQAANFTYLGLYALQHRGQESAGIASSDTHHIYRYAGMGKVLDIFTEYHIENLKGTMAIGHNRYSTTGSSFLRNAQPLRAESRLGPIVLAHNGNLINTEDMRRKLVDEGSIFQTSIDSEIIIHLMAKSGYNDFKDALIHALKQLTAAYSVLIMNREKIYACRDPFGFRPLCLGKIDGAYAIASETCAFDIIDAEFIRDIEPGELIEIGPNGIESFYPFDNINVKKQSLCVFEYIYFSRPDSFIFGHSVHEMRLKLGRQLAIDSPVEADLVIPIPDSSISAALGYAMESGIRFEKGMTRNHYIGRTFIEPSQKIRDFGAKIKYNVVKSAVKGKRIILVDDSIMRGTTMRKIIKMFRNAGATEVHVRISAPPTKYPCFYGIDIPTKSELIASTHTIEEIVKYMRVDSLAYMTTDSLLKAIDRKDMSFCNACFTGRYPVEFVQPEDENLKFQFDAGNGEFY
ncbi:MAG: amidophosphoribosyltransferase [Spirochaetes bacterium]|nr:amidophosphoribosyltransferase [Spirochaetota bacterium]